MKLKNSKLSEEEVQRELDDLFSAEPVSKEEEKILYEDYIEEED